MIEKPLSQREKEVLQAVADADGDFEIAAWQIGLAFNTLRVHVVSAAKKLGTSHQGTLATILVAHRQGIIVIRE